MNKTTNYLVRLSRSRNHKLACQNSSKKVVQPFQSTIDVGTDARKVGNTAMFEIQLPKWTLCVIESRQKRLYKLKPSQTY